MAREKVIVTVSGRQRAIWVDPNATNGAIIGVNLRLQDGTVVTLDILRTLISGGAAATSGSSGFAATFWSLIQEIPANVRAVAALAQSGFVRRSGAGAWSAAPLGPSDLPYPMVQNSLGVGESLTIPAGFQMIVANEFDDEGALTIEGALVIL